MTLHTDSNRWTAAGLGWDRRCVQWLTALQDPEHLTPDRGVVAIELLDEGGTVALYEVDVGDGFTMYASCGGAGARPDEAVPIRRVYRGGPRPPLAVVAIMQDRPRPAEALRLAGLVP